MIIIVGLELLVSLYCFFCIFHFCENSTNFKNLLYVHVSISASKYHTWLKKNELPNQFITYIIGIVYLFYFSIKLFYNVKFDLLCRNIHLHSYIFRFLRSIHPKGNTICLSYLQYISRNSYTISVDISVVLFLF